MGGSPAMKEKAHAKINLFLDVVGKRLDNFHNLEMIMAPLALHDVLTFQILPENKVEVESNKRITETPEENLVYKVAEHMLKTYGIKQGVKITIDKKIPIAAGLAGGSADAAATLRGLNRLFKLKLSDDILAEIGETFGADIPFCIHNKLCIARGKGEELVFLNKKLKIPVLLVTPDIEVRTRDVFALVNIDEVEHKKITTISNAIYNCNIDLLCQSLYNALEPFTFQKFDIVKTLKKDILAEAVDGALMSGTGPTVFVIDKRKDKLEQLRKKYENDHFVCLTKIT